MANSCLKNFRQRLCCEASATPQPTEDGCEYKVKFPLGRFHVMPRAGKLLSGLEIGYALSLHAQGDWGNVSKETWTKNDSSLQGGGRLLSFFSNHNGVTFYILTEANRSTTSLFLPQEHEIYFLPGARWSGNGQVM